VSSALKAVAALVIVFVLAGAGITINAVVAARMSRRLNLPRESLLWGFLLPLAFGLAIGVQIGMLATA